MVTFMIVVTASIAMVAQTVTFINDLSIGRKLRKTLGLSSTISHYVESVDERPNSFVGLVIAVVGGQ